MGVFFSNQTVKSRLADFTDVSRVQGFLTANAQSTIK